MTRILLRNEYAMITEALDAIDLDETAIRPDYCGRFAQSGFGILFPRISVAFRFFMEFTLGSVDRTPEHDLDRVRQFIGSLADVAEIERIGHDVIVFFPHTYFIKEES